MQMITLVVYCLFQYIFFLEDVRLQLRIQSFKSYVNYMALLYTRPE